MESIGRSAIMGSNTNTAVSTIANATSSAVVGLLLSHTRPSVATISSNTKTTGLCHNGNQRMPLQHCANGSNVIQHHQYTPILVASQPPTLVPIHSAQTGSMLPASPQLMLSTATVTTSGVIPQFQQHNGPHQLVTAAAAPVSVTPIAMPSSNVTSVGMALSPFGILPHERVVPHNTHHRHQHRKLQCPQSSKIIMDNTNNTSGTQILTAPAVNSQRFYIEPTHPSNKIKQYDSIQPQAQAQPQPQPQSQPQHRIKIVNSISDKSLPVVSNAYVPQPYEQRYQPRTAPQQVGYLSVITRTAVPTTNGVMNDITANNNYYQAQPLPLQSKTPDNHDRQYYHFDNTVSASQTPQQQLDNILLMGTPVQRGDPMHIVKNLQSMQTDIDCYGVKKMIDQQPRLMATDNGKTISPTNLLGNNNNKCLIEHQHQHLQQLPKSALIDPSSSYSDQYFNRRQPPPAHLHHHHNQSHLQQHIVTGNAKMLPTPTSLTVVSANGNTYLDVQQHQRNHRWNLDHQKPPIVSTSSCFTGNISSGIFHQPSLHQHHHQQQYNNTVQSFNVQPPPTSVNHQHQHVSQPTHHNNFTVSSVDPTYYSPTTTMVSPTVTSVTTTSPSLALYNQTQNNNQRQHNNIFQDFSNNLQGGSYVVNDDNKPLCLPHVVVPNIEEELRHLCDDSTTTTTTTTTTTDTETTVTTTITTTTTSTTTRVKPLNIITQKPSFIDSYIKFIHGGTSGMAEKPEDECNDKSKKLSTLLLSSSPKPISKPYVPLPKPKVLTTTEQTSRNGSGEDIKKTNNVTTTTTDDDPRYFPLPKTSSIAGLSDDRSDGSNGENSWLSDDEQDQWWISSSKASSNTTATSVIKNKVDVFSKKKNSGTTKRKRTNTVVPIKKQKTYHNIQQPKRQLSHRLAKEKSQQLLSSLNGELDVDDNDALSDTDSDVDPAWRPNNDDNDIPKISNSMNSRHKKYSKEQNSNNSHSPSTSSSINNNNNDHLDDSTVFKSGTFVALKRQFLDNEHVYPQHLWRVDGKSLLQKFTRCNENNMYKSVSTYTGWSPSHYNMYRQVDVKIITSENSDNSIPNKSSTIEILVQLLPGNSNKPVKNNSIVKTTSSTYNHISKLKVDAINSNLSTNSFVDEQSVMLRTNFDVYIQSLASQALDSNFLEEIYREKDQYFLSNLSAIETVTETWKKTIDSTMFKDVVTDLSKVENVWIIIAKYPNMEINSLDEKSRNNINLRCLVCGNQELVKKQQKEFVEICLSGMEYSSQTLKNINSNTFSKATPVKRFHCCSSAQCVDKLTILHSLEHLKYYIYKECCKRVTAESENSCNDSTRDTTNVLNRLLADDEWIEKLFNLVCNTWSQAKSFVSKNQSNCRAVSS
ncbi:probable WRKY transcription factor protein 1 [Melanaphis sacchari]|uniref:probable WRKY transcription factor protein 1 n=1 Tax=Melanaphis sacchari TaxID=742174 RepID=UPI000DC15699|nr:probable WRKY transcription factor protein 1 [Melanaphis sacchari]